MDALKVAIMQPYFFPYIGYWQLIGAVDAFVVYDDIQYTKKGWINRNRILSNGEPALFSLPLSADSDYLDIRERFVAASADKHIQKTLRQIRSNYEKAPWFKDVFPLVEQCFRHSELNLFEYIFNSIKVVMNYLGLTTKLIISSELSIDRSLKGQDRVLATCLSLGATNYVNAIGGLKLYSKEVFRNENINLAFLETIPFEYKQLGSSFVPNLSIIDLMMFCDKAELGELLKKYRLL